MGAALLALVALGSQDAYLTSNPTVTWWKASYRRYTMFSQEHIPQTVSGTVDFGAQRLSCTITRHADMLSDLYMTVRLPSLIPYTADFFDGAVTTQIPVINQYCDYAALALLEMADFEIGGSRIDRLYSSYIYAIHDLGVASSHRAGIETILGNALISKRETETECVVPLPFWFTSHPGLSISLVSLQYHECRLTFSLNSLSHLTKKYYDQATSSIRIFTERDDGAPLGVGEDITNATRRELAADMIAGGLELQIWGQYTFLDAVERKKFALSSSESLITQTQQTVESIGTGSSRTVVRLNINHPVVELIVLPQSAAAKSLNAHFNFYSSSDILTHIDVGSLSTVTTSQGYFNPCTEVVLKLNNHELQTGVPGSRLNLYTPYRTHTAVPQDKGIMVMPFCLSPETAAVQPSGSINFSRIDSAVLELEWDARFSVDGGDVTVYARNLNVLRWAGGMAGVGFSN